MRIKSVSPRSAFSVIELLTAMVILSIIMLAVITVIGESSAIWRRASNKIESFQAARSAFEILTRNLSQATLNTYYDYDNPDSPTRYLRRSELHFVLGQAGDGLPGTSGTGQAVFFQAPANVVEEANTGTYGQMPGLLNSCGYYVEFDEEQYLPSHVSRPTPLYRYRLMQLVVPTEQNQIYNVSNPAPGDFSWFSPFASSDALPIADNVVALILLPKDPVINDDDPAAGAIPPANFTYNSRLGITDNPQPIFANQLPPIVLVTMIAISEQSANLITEGSSQPSVITSALAGKFTSASSYLSDIEAVQDALNSATPPVNYRIFSSAVPLRESKWTKE